MVQHLIDGRYQLGHEETGGACRCTVRDIGYMPEQVQDFLPPSTMSTCMALHRRRCTPLEASAMRYEKAMQRA